MTHENPPGPLRTAPTRLPLPAAFVLAVVSLCVSTGCTTILNPIAGIPVSQVPPELLGERRSEYVPVPVVMLALPPNLEYRLAEGDILGVYIEGVLPFTSPTSVPMPPPVNFPDAGSELPPSIGYPVAIQEGGILNLPLLEPFSVDGMTIAEAREAINNAYRSREILASADTVPVVTLIRERSYNVTVIRSNAGEAQGVSTGTAAGYDLKLPAYQNDVLHALTQTGGLPGFNEKNEVIVFKTSRIPAERRTEIMAQLMSGPAECLQSWMSAAEGGSGQAICCYEGMIEDRFIIRIPLRVPPGQIPQIPVDDIELDEGDVVFVESREAEIYYTGGLLPGGQFRLPRDYDLDVLGALALAGSGVASQQNIGAGIVQGIGGASPTQLYVIRKLECGRTFNIAVDLQQALNDSTQNILVQPGDTLVLRFKPHEELVNFGLGTFFTFGIRELFSD